MCFCRSQCGHTRPPSPCRARRSCKQECMCICMCMCICVCVCVCHDRAHITQKHNEETTAIDLQLSTPSPTPPPPPPLPLPPTPTPTRTPTHVYTLAHNHPRSHPHTHLSPLSTAGNSGLYFTVNARASMTPSVGQLEGMPESGKWAGASSSYLEGVERRKAIESSSECQLQLLGMLNSSCWEVQQRRRKSLGSIWA